MPDSYDFDDTFIMIDTINNSGGFANDFPDRRIAKFRNDTTGFGKID